MSLLYIVQCASWESKFGRPLNFENQDLVGPYNFWLSQSLVMTESNDQSWQYVFWVFSVKTDYITMFRGTGDSIMMWFIFIILQQMNHLWAHEFPAHLFHVTSHKDVLQNLCKIKHHTATNHQNMFIANESNHHFFEIAVFGSGYL